MTPQIDLFHQPVYSEDGYVAITDYTDERINTHIYTPDGVWCGCSGASNPYTLMADVKHIIKFRKAYDIRRKKGKGR